MLGVGLRKFMSKMRVYSKITKRDSEKEKGLLPGKKKPETRHMLTSFVYASQIHVASSKQAHTCIDNAACS